ncbi:MAG: hypothetical protein HY291_01215 [Planctomycetes bacterium]|nr:hypothetical protein [Planctomycetota bacterium]
MPVKTRSAAKKKASATHKKSAPEAKKAPPAAGRHGAATVTRKSDPKKTEDKAEAPAEHDRSSMKKHSKHAGAEASESSDKASGAAAAPQGRTALIKLRHEMMKKEIDQIREDLENEENEE